jgi:hypothetical protein
MCALLQTRVACHSMMPADDGYISYKCWSNTRHQTVCKSLKERERASSTAGLCGPPAHLPSWLCCCCCCWRSPLLVALARLECHCATARLPVAMSEHLQLAGPKLAAAAAPSHLQHTAHIQAISRATAVTPDVFGHCNALLFLQLACQERAAPRAPDVMPAPSRRLLC